MTDGFTRRKEHSKEEIRRAASDLFGRFGVEKVSIADIARKAGVSQATIYNNFGSKEALAREFVTGMIDTLVHQAQNALQPDRPFEEKIEALIAFITRAMTQGQALGDIPPVFRGIPDLLFDPEIQRIHNAAQERMTHLLLDLIHEGKEQGHIRPDFSDEAFRAYLQAFMGIFTDPRFLRKHNQDPALAHQVADLMIYGIRGKSS
jgi:AcrR family transcriptional regulator